LSEAVRNTKRVERSTDRNLPTMSTTFAVKVESPRRCGYLLFFYGNPKYYVSQTGNGINRHHCSYGKYL